MLRIYCFPNEVLGNCRISFLSRRKIVRKHGRFASSSMEKDFFGPLPNTYEPEKVESGWYEYWQQKRLFQQKQGTKEVFSMVLPPPNVTGDLHLGHALTCAIEDTIARWHRSKGSSVVWMPGFDHAGIATQVVVEKLIKAKTGQNRSDISRDEFLREANHWKDMKIENIRKQLQFLGCSLDWTRETFTLNESFSRGVRECFIRLYDRGLIKRKKRLVNWCCHLKSAISDEEVQNINIPAASNYTIPISGKIVSTGILTHFAYNVEDSNERIIVATTRPETMLADVCVAVNPLDSRHSHLIGRSVVHPFDGRRLPIIGDDSVRIDFGTGCVKISPGHDHNDFELAERRGLPLLNILDENGNVLSENSLFKGKSRYEVRTLIVDELRRLGLFKAEIGHEMSLPVCSRTGDIIEPLLKFQWFLDTSDAYEELQRALETGQIVIEPSSALSVLLEFLKDKRDWCISRQLLWGHQIPAYRIATGRLSEYSDIWSVGNTVEEAAQKVSKNLGTHISPVDLVQDENVLDTWFSSTLLPFVAFGWPDNLCNNFYPLSLLETGHDIIFFWVARMAIMGHMMTGRWPFKKVLVHGLICDAHGRKMSKSVGNVVDPSDIINGITLKDLQTKTERLFMDGYINKQELDRAKNTLKVDFPNGIPRCGADGLRLALLSQDFKKNFINIDVKYAQNCQHFGNKIWQAYKFFNLACDKTKTQVHALNKVKYDLSATDRWMLSQLSNFVINCNNFYSNYDLHLVAKAMRIFWYSTLCDIYLEAIKPIIHNNGNKNSKEQRACLSTLNASLETATICSAPLMPFLMEELYHRALRIKDAPPRLPSVSMETFPDAKQWEEWQDPKIEEIFSDILETVAELRRIRVEYDITKIRPEVHLLSKDEEILSFFEKDGFQFLEPLSRCIILGVNNVKSFPTPPTHITRNISQKISIVMKLEGTVDLMKTIGRYNKRLDKYEKEINMINKRIKNSDYSNVTSLNTREKDESQLKSLEKTLLQVKRNLAELNLLATLKN